MQFGKLMADMAKKYFTRKKKPDMARLRTEYAAYRKRMTKKPDAVINTLRFNDWKKTARPGK